MTQAVTQILTSPAHGSAAGPVLAVVLPRFCTYLLKDDVL